MLGKHLTVLSVTLIAVQTHLLAFGGQGRLVVPYITGRPEVHPLTGFTGWIDAYERGYGKGVSARINSDGTFELPESTKPAVVIAFFDRMETPALVFTQWPGSDGSRDLLIPTEYACVPAGYPEVWDKEYAIKATFFAQTFVPQCTQIYGVSVFDGPKAGDPGNQLHMFVHEGGPDTKALLLQEHQSPDPGMGGHWDMVTGGFSDHGLSMVGYRHGNIPVSPGKEYTVRFYGLASPARKYEFPGYIRPDSGDGYAHGHAYARGGKPVEGDLCCLIFGNSHGQLIENQICGEEWEVFVAPVRPTQDFGQTFESHGVSMAGVSFWASSGGEQDVECDIQILTEGPWGKKLGPAKVARAHPSPHKPIVRYQTPAPLKGYEAFYEKPCQFFQAAWHPDEIQLEPGKTYYVSIAPSKPLMTYGDGDFYQKGYAYYDGLKVDRQVSGKRTFHSYRWTIAMNIVTYANPGGKPMAAIRPAE